MIDLKKEDDLKQLIESSGKTILIDFWATWCNPCKQLGQTLDSIKDDYADKLQIVKIDLEEHPQLAAQYRVRSVPTMIVLKDGYPEDTHIGSGSEKVIRDFIDRNL